MPQIAEMEARRLHHIVRPSACEDSFQEHRGGSARKGRTLFAGFVARTGEERLPHRVMFGELVGGDGYTGGQENGLAHLKERYLGIWNEILTVAKMCSETRHLASTRKGGSPVVHAETA